jgi:UPF0755 protein
VIRKLLVGFSLLALLVVVGLVELRKRWEAPLPIPEGGLALEVASGESLAALARRLHQQGALPYPRLLTWYGRWSGQDQRLKRGEYHVSVGTTAETLLQLLESGEVVHYQVTLPEGITLGQALQILSAEEALATTLKGPQDDRILSLVAPSSTGEGWFFPDSYRYVRGDSDWQLLQRAYKAMARQLQEEWAARDDGLPYETPYEALIMASIIEKETGLAEERGQIAGVFVRRLQQGMRLQTDPTIIYGLGETFDGNLTRKHLADSANPYNSYRHDGLPPTPIALPGRGAIHAALHPEPGEALYFVARGDGGHVFSASLAEHERAVRKYQLRRRSDYRSSPEKK